ncbi:MAG TPA: hypothetical protein PLF37_15075 [Planctomycetota bacterium]|nr:hypothetical protein [Planctomycetota bacterium]
MPDSATVTDLRQIRLALENNARLTSVSGVALLLSGLLAFVAIGITSNLGAATPAARLKLEGATLEALALLWGATLIITVALNLAGMMLRARLDGQPLAARLGKRVLFAMLPALFVGGVLTLGLLVHQRLDLIFSVWMLCYGAALVAASSHSVTSVKFLGLWTLFCGALALFPPASSLDTMLFTGTFGAGHLLLGIWVGVRYGW